MPNIDLGAIKDDGSNNKVKNKKHDSLALGNGNMPLMVCQILYIFGAISLFSGVIIGFILDDGFLVIIKSIIFGCMCSAFYFALAAIIHILMSIDSKIQR